MITKKLQAIQSELDVPKSQFNAFGKYYYRNAEDILAAAKPVCIKHDCLLIVTDEIVMLNDRFYIKATARLISGEAVMETTAYAREEETKKGMDAAQITGSASSYARKYALNGLFCIDDVKDADHNGKDNDKAPYDAAKETFDKPKEDKKPPQKAAPGKVEKKTLDRIKNRADEVGIEKEDLRAMAKEMFGVTKSADMTEKQAAELDSKLIDRLEGANA